MLTRRRNPIGVLLSLLLLLSVASACAAGGGSTAPSEAGSEGRATDTAAVSEVTGPEWFRDDWQASRSEFEKLAGEAERGLPRTEIREIGLDLEVGRFRSTQVYQQGEAVIFYIEGAGYIDDAGVAYLPEGPFAELESGSFERPEFTLVDGHWYTWTASW